MLFKFTYPTRPEMGDEYHELIQANFTGTMVDDQVAFMVGDDNAPLYFDPRGLEIYLLDSRTGKTVDRVKWTVAKYV